MATIFHLALASDWETARAAGRYTMSTRGRTLAEVGFIHASRADQWTTVRDRFYADVGESMVLLQIDTDRLDVPVVEEAGEPGSAETFPHIYGPLPVDAVVRALPLPDTGARTASPPPTAQACAPADGRSPSAASPEGSFTAVFFREMFVNAALILLVVGCGFAGILGGQSAGGDGDAGPGIGGLLGVVVGLTLAVLIHRHRDARRTS